ncbi:hypothetical protein [Sphingomonas sp. TREG-RG-20F-R18-01]|uniref:hypothetical protein n=1 Tax=Sphingomonas sp. TREG-RG-20F-R18-01 TaxID=2914982 RepID=UPI001F598EDF|nr:hypothetical protein [Sphingomonas sp. TREG-RG-20F-R18-01]
MSRPTDNDRQAPGETLRGSLLFLGFGMTMLAFLVAIDRPEWFVLRPATGTAVAMSAAPTVPARELRAARDEQPLRHR